MDHLIAKTKGGKGSLLIVLSGESIYDTPKNLKNTKLYEATYKKEDGEWFIIHEFSKQPFSIDFIKKEFISAEYNQIKVKDYSNIEFLCAVQGEMYHFQKVSSSFLLGKKWLSFSSSPKFITGESIIIIKNSPDAIYDKSKDILYFKKLASIVSIFKGIENLYRVATNNETEKFLNSDFIKLGESYGKDSVKTANRKRIALAIDTLKKIPKKNKKKLFSYIKVYCKNVKFNKSAFEIKTENDLKQILFGIEQRYYTAPFSREKRLANSITKLL